MWYVYHVEKNVPYYIIHTNNPIAHLFNNIFDLACVHLLSKNASSIIMMFSPLRCSLPFIHNFLTNYYLYVHCRAFVSKDMHAHSLD